MRALLSVCAWFVTALLSGGAEAQSTLALTTVRGVAFDSVRGVPLQGAFVSVAGRVASTDSAGRFLMDSVPSGPHILTLQHDSLDSIGLTGISARIVAASDAIPLVVSTPGVASLWRSACGRVPPTADSGMVFGTVRDAVRRTGATATVVATWVDLNVSAEAAFKQKRWTLSTTADSSGSFALCGLPLDAALQLRAATGTMLSGSIDVLAGC